MTMHKTKYPGVYRRGERFIAKVYTGKVNGRSTYEWLPGKGAAPFPTAKAASVAKGDRERELRDDRRATGGRAAFTVAAYRERWLRQLDARVSAGDDLKASTVVNYREQTSAFAKAHGDRLLTDIDIEDALDWLLGQGEDAPGKRWTRNGIRALFTAARKAGHVPSNPFAELRLRGSKGRRDLEVLTLEQIHDLADRAPGAWPREGYGQTWRAAILTAAFTGLRPGELYALRWADLDLPGEELTVARQVGARAGEYTTPKNGLQRTVVLGGPALDALRALPRPIDAGQIVFRTVTGRPMSARAQHYYWHPIRVAAGRPLMAFYELRHFCGSYLLNDCELPAQDVAHQLGHTDGGELVLGLYGHPSKTLARDRVKRALAGRSVVSLADRHDQATDAAGGPA